MKKKFLALFASLTVVVGAVLLFNFMSTNSDAASMPRDCDNNSIVYCGVLTQAELIKKFDENKNDVQKIYAHYGITRDDITGKTSQVKMGKIYKDGRIVVDGKVVATGAHSVGRQNTGGSKDTKVTINGKTYYQRKDTSGFQSDYIDAFVLMRDGRFYRAIMTSCGNPTIATAKKPEPKPTYACDSLAAKKISRDQYQFTAKASAANGATITGYSYDFGDGKKENSTKTSISHTYAKAGTYTAKLTVSVKVGSETKTATAASCEVKVTVENPPAPEYKCDALGARLQDETTRKYVYDLSYTVKNGATLKTVDYDFGDGQNKNGVSPAETKNVSHAYAKAGTYKTVATLHFNVNDTVKDVKCETSITISPEMCPLNPSLPKDDEGCAPCAVPGKEQYPKDSPECYENCDVPGKEHLPKDSPDCVETPVTPPEIPQTPETPAELPKTGAGDFIGGGLGLGSVIAALYYWVVSRRGLADAMLNR